VRYANEDHGSDDQFRLDCDDDEPYVSPLLPSPPLLTRHIDAYELELGSLFATTRRASEPEPPLVPHFSFFGFVFQPRFGCAIPSDHPGEAARL